MPEPSGGADDLARCVAGFLGCGVGKDRILQGDDDGVEGVGGVGLGLGGAVDDDGRDEVVLPGAAFDLRAELGEAIRADASLAAVKLVFLGSIGSSLSRRELDELGVAASLAKPVRQALLQETLEKLVAQKESAPPFPTKVTRAPVAPPTAELKLRILLAEDNPVNQQVARLQLQRFGYHADIVVDGEKAVEAVRAADYDIVLMDCQMPELDGFGATRQIRAWEQERRMRGEQFTPLHIIAMTANAMVGDREACMAAGMNDYVSKPVRPADLAAAIAQAPAAHA